MTRSGILMADNYEGFYSAHLPKRNVPFVDPMARHEYRGFLSAGHTLKVESWVAPSLVARMFKANADFASKRCAIGLAELRRTIDAFADVERHEVSVPVTPVVENGPNDCFELHTYAHDRPTAGMEASSKDVRLVPRMKPSLQVDSPKDNIYVFVKNNVQIDEEAYERFAVAATHEETSMIASEMAMRSMRGGSKRSATKYSKLARQSTAYAHAAEAGDQEAMYRSAGHSAAAQLSQVNGDEDE